METYTMKYTAELSPNCQRRWFRDDTGPERGVRHQRIEDREVTGMHGTTTRNGRVFSAHTNRDRYWLNFRVNPVDCCGMKELYATNVLNSKLEDWTIFHPLFAYRFWCEVGAESGDGLTAYVMTAKVRGAHVPEDPLSWADPDNRGRREHSGIKTATVMLHMAEIAKQWGIIDYTVCPAYRNKNSGNVLFPILITPTARSTQDNTTGFGVFTRGHRRAIHRPGIVRKLNELVQSTPRLTQSTGWNRSGPARIEVPVKITVPNKYAVNSSIYMQPPHNFNKEDYQ